MATQYHTPSASAIAYFESLGGTSSYRPSDDEAILIRINATIVKSPNPKKMNVIEINRQKTIDMRNRQINAFFGESKRAPYFTIGKDADGLPIVTRK